MGRGFHSGHWSRSLDRFENSAPLARLDSYWYSTIAVEGYEWKADGGRHNVGFFPLYPAILSTIYRAIGIHPFLSGSVVSILALLLGVRLAAELAGEEGFDPRFAVGAMLLFPVSFFLVAVYSESLFLLFSAGCLLALRRGRPARAAAFGFFAGLTRPMGFLLALAILWGGLDRARKTASRKTLLAWLAASAGPPAGAGAYAVYLWFRFGSPLVYLQTQSVSWHHKLLQAPWTPLLHAVLWSPSWRLESALVVAFALLSVLLFVRGFRPEGVYGAATILFILETDGIVGAPRYLLLLFPCFFLIGEGMRRWRILRWAYGIAGALGLAYLTARFAIGYFV